VTSKPGIFLPAARACLLFAGAMLSVFSAMLAGYYPSTVSTGLVRLGHCVNVIYQDRIRGARSDLARSVVVGTQLSSGLLPYERGEVKIRMIFCGGSWKSIIGLAI